jgi:excisionase family DNA binding protein
MATKGGKTAKKATGAKKSARKQPRAAVAEPEGELITMDQAIEMLKTTRPTFYRWLRSGKVKGMKIGRQWRFYRKDIERFLKGEAPRVDLPASMKPLLKALHTRLKDVGGTDAPSKDANDVQQAVGLMISICVAMRGSDLHITSHLMPDLGDPKTVIRCRVDGVLHPIGDVDLRLLPAIIQEWKRMAACDVHETKLPQDGRIVVKIRTGKGDETKTLDLRVNFLPAALGESLTVRILDTSVVCLELDRIDYSTNVRGAIDRSLELPYGMIIVAGPTGCGKTTTLYCCLNRLASAESKLLSIEDPVEYFLPWVTQIGVNPQAGLTFKRAMIACLRSAPNTIMIGELRDGEMVDLAQRAALTGHLILTTMHTDNTAAALRRMLDVDADPVLTTDATRLVISQRLIRLLCKECSEAATPSAELLAQAAQAARDGGLDFGSLPQDYRKGVGCKRCNQTGYRGRTVIAEALEMSPSVAKAVHDDATTDAIRAIAVQQGMITLAADGVQRAAQGQTTLEEIFRAVR